MDIGFRNMAGCPLHAYWVAPDTCMEEFHFHLGVERNTPDYFHDWKSMTKFEYSLLGASFVFRSAQHPEIVVDTVTLEATRVTDCPNLQNQVNTLVTAAEPLAVMVNLASLRGRNTTIVDKVHNVTSRMPKHMTDWNATKEVLFWPMRSHTV